ncbi:MAG TPA: hypothetical protein PLF50_06065 [Candidatus Cloacimonadota bacterium]|nr:hypothetical protein [Candidatus Cloacimonadota bacterium]
MLSYIDEPYIRKLYKGLTIETVEAKYTVSGSIQTQTESMIKNFN